MFVIVVVYNGDGRKVNMSRFGWSRGELGGDTRGGRGERRGKGAGDGRGRASGGVGESEGGRGRGSDGRGDIKGRDIVGRDSRGGGRRRGGGLFGGREDVVGRKRIAHFSERFLFGGGGEEVGDTGCV